MQAFCQAIVAYLAPPHQLTHLGGICILQGRDGVPVKHFPKHFGINPLLAPSIPTVSSLHWSGFLVVSAMIGPCLLLQTENRTVWEILHCCFSSCDIQGAEGAPSVDLSYHIKQIIAF